MLHASCHCGAITIELGFVPESLTECNCSICRRNGARWAYGTRRNIRVHGDPDTGFSYCWGDRTLNICGCGICGCVTHWESRDEAADARMAVNARMLAPEDVAGIPVRRLDGADSWKYLDD